MTITRSAALILLILSLLAGQVLAGESLSYGAQAREFIARGDYDKAVEELRRAAALYPYNLAVKTDVANGLAEIAQRYMKLSRYAEAAEYFGEAHGLSPDNKDLGLMRGLALYLAKNYEAARAEFEQAPDRVEAVAYLGKISYDTGDVAGAVATWRGGLEKDPSNKMLLALLEKAERELPVESKMEKGYSSMFDLSFDAELPPGLSAEVLDALESAYSTVGADLGHFPRTRIPVLLYTKKDYSSVTAGPDWSGGLYDGKIRLPVGGITKVGKQLRGIIFHEYTHVVIAELTRGNIPTWLNEGLAVIEERKEFSHPSFDVAAAARDGKLLPLSTLSGGFTSMSNAQAGLAYEQSFSIANFMVSRYGWYAVQGILKALGERAAIEAAVAKALADQSMDLPAVMGEWRESLK